jgi:hypothetical protein
MKREKHAYEEMSRRADIELARRANLARSTGCHEQDDPQNIAHGVVLAVCAGGLIWGIALLLIERFF